MSEQSKSFTPSLQASLVSLGSWCAVVAGGFAYVSGVLCHRDNLLHSGNGSSVDLLLVLLVSPLFFILGVRHNWHPAKTSASAVFLWNGLCYLLPFFLALHWEYVGSFLDVKFSLKASHLGSLDPRSTLVLGTAVSAIAALLVLHLVWAWREGIHYPYMAALVGIPCLVGISSLLLGDSYHIHVHHYCLGAFLFPFFRFRKIISTVSQALFLGLAIEGISRWGMDPLWYYVR